MSGRGARRRRAERRRTTPPVAAAPVAEELAPVADRTVVAAVRRRPQPREAFHGPFEVALSPVVQSVVPGLCGPGHHDIKVGHPIVATSADRAAHPRCLPTVPPAFRHPVGAPYPGGSADAHTPTEAL